MSVTFSPVRILHNSDASDANNRFVFASGNDLVISEPTTIRKGLDGLWRVQPRKVTGRQRTQARKARRGW